jgi:citronellol/citronellal dehydrogenase
MSRLTGRIALVTGASRGLGKAIAAALAAQGAHVAVVARTLETGNGQPGSLRETVSVIADAGGAATPFAADLSDPENCEQLVASIRARLGEPTVLVNSAAVTFLRPLANFPLSRIQVMLNLHLLTPLRLTQLLAPGMRAAGAGWIVNLTSVAAQPNSGPPFDEFATTAGFGMYGTVKAALDRLTSSLAAEFQDAGIAVNAAAPLLPVATPGARTLDLAKSGTEDIALICRTVVELCTGDPRVLTGRIEYTTPFLEKLEAGEVAGAYDRAAASQEASK